MTDQRRLTSLPPHREAELQRYMDSIARRLLDERLEREELEGQQGGQQPPESTP